MSNKNKNRVSTPYAMTEEESAMFRQGISLSNTETQAENLLPDENTGLPATRLECLKLAHSAAKSVEEVLKEAGIYTAWVLTGKSKNDLNAG